MEERLGKASTADKLKQEFYLLGQEIMEKIQQFASHLEQKYRKLQTKSPGHYDRKQLKDTLFLACISNYMIPCVSSINRMRQHIRQEEEGGATELKNTIDSLTAILKSSTLGISKPEGKEKKE